MVQNWIWSLLSLLRSCGCSPTCGRIISHLWGCLVLVIDGVLCGFVFLWSNTAPVFPEIVLLFSLLPTRVHFVPALQWELFRLHGVHCGANSCGTVLSLATVTGSMAKLFTSLEIGVVLCRLKAWLVCPVKLRSSQSCYLLPAAVWYLIASSHKHLQ